MAGTTLTSLPPALALNGNELVWIYQQTGNPANPWVGLSTTTGQIAGLVLAGSLGSVSMRQLFAAMAAQGVMVTAFEALPADITNTNSIAWNYAYRMTLSDTFITGFLQPAIGYSTAQMQALFALATTYPV